MTRYSVENIPNFMKKISFLLALLIAGWSAAGAAPASTNSAAANRILIIDSSSMPIGGGSATLIIGTLHRVNGVYIGDYKLKVFPYFLKSDKGRLAIVVSDASLAKVNRGKVAAITGTATTNGKGGTCRPIAAIATPADINHGKLKLWFMAGSRQMVFEPAYHFAEAGTAAILPPLTAPRLAANPAARRAASWTEYREAFAMDF
jgi:hypothetical protein